jgi:hypothetical protein
MIHESICKVVGTGDENPWFHQNRLPVTREKKTEHRKKLEIKLCHTGICQKNGVDEMLSKNGVWT